MSLKISFVFLILFTSVQVNLKGQIIEGRIYDSKTKLVVPYVNVGVVNRGIGTVTNDSGYFKLDVSTANRNDTLKCSMIGYTSKVFAIKDLVSGTIYIDERIVELDAVVINPKKVKEVTIGNLYDSPYVSAGFNSNDLGTEAGTVMKVKNKKTYYLKKAGINIAYCNYDSILFRINIYDFKNGKPGEILLLSPIYVKVVKGQRNLEMDLTQYNIEVTNDFLLSLEWIQDMPDKQKGFMFCAGFFGEGVRFRKTSQDTWYNAAVLGIGMYCVAEYEK